MKINVLQATLTTERRDFFITPCACARGKVIGSVIVTVISTKIARSQDIGVLAGGQYCQIATSLYV